MPMTEPQAADQRQLEDAPQPLRGDPARAEAVATCSPTDDYDGRRRVGAPAVHRPPLGADGARGRQASRSRLGAQHCHWEEKGAFTGEVAPAMLAKLNVPT